MAVGTTSMRTLEHLALTLRDGPSAAGPDSATACRGETALFITPGFEFRVVDALLTNFHLPRTSLLALVMAFCGVDADAPPLRARRARALPLLQLRRRDAGSVRHR